MERVSVCLACYNGGRFIEKQLLSILSQLSTNDEIIISDDGSIDDTIDIINAIADKRITLIMNYGIPGPIGNFESALRKATGKYIFLSDQDDVWLPNKVSTLKSLLDKYDLVLSDCIVVSDSEKIIHESFFKYRNSKPGFLRNIYKNSYMGCCMAFRHDILTYVLPFPSGIHMHDWWIGLLVEIKGKVCFYPQPMIRYVRHGSNASPTGDLGYGYIEKISNRFFMSVNVIRRLFV